MTAKATAWVPERNSLSWSTVVKSSSVMMVFIPHHERNPSQLQTHFMLESSRPFRLTSYWKRLPLSIVARVCHSDEISGLHPVQPEPHSHAEEMGQKFLE